MTTKLIAASLLACAHGLAQAQGYPSKIVRMIVPSAPGGGQDVVTRALALLRVREFHFSLMEISFFIGKEKVVAREGTSWFFGLFILLHRMMLGATDYYKIPEDHAVELGGHISI